jgi:4-hydroxybenzoyl-CoA thioesterase
MPPLTNTRRLIIEWGQCDPAGIVFNKRFFEIFDQSTWELFEAALGVKPHELARTYGIIGIPVVDVKANFSKPLKFGDKIEIASCVSEFRRSSFDVEHKIQLDGHIAVEGIETRVWAARDKATEKAGAVPVPPQVVARFGGA